MDVKEDELGWQSCPQQPDFNVHPRGWGLGPMVTPP
jgi:hypothetical protein